LLIITALAALDVPTAWLPNESDVGVTDMTDLTPVPDNATCRVPAPLAATTVNNAVFDPVPVGLNLTEIVQAPPAGTGEEQLWLWEN
jgi:hypothetical protein